MAVQLVKKKVQIAIFAIILVLALVAVTVILAASILIGALAGDTKISLAADTSCLPAGTTVSTAGANTRADVQTEQVENAKAIDAKVKELGYSGAASRIAIITAMGESSLLNIKYGDEAQGVTNADGSATTSKGLFQQQTSMGWGTVEEVTDPSYATESFILGRGGNKGLSDVAGWDKMEPTQAIHRVQNNADPSHYSQFYAEADAVIEKAKIDVERDGKTADANGGQEPDTESLTATSCGSSGGKDGASGVVKASDAKDDYPYKDRTPPPGQYTADPWSFYYGECTSFVAWRMNRDMGVTEGPWKFDNGSGGVKKGNGGEWKAAWEKAGWKVSNKPVPGAVAWWGAWGGGTAEAPKFSIGSAGHVAYVADVTEDGKAVIEEYNNSYYAPPGHKYNVRPEPVAADQVNLFLYPPPKG